MSHIRAAFSCSAALTSVARRVAAALSAAAALFFGFLVRREERLMELCQQEPVIVVADSNASPEEACQVFFDGDYHYCGDAGRGYVLCCLGGAQ
jgi:hypothetical protein